MDAADRPAEAVLDYASPRKFSSIRLPAQSKLTFESSGPNHLRILEQLKGADNAIGAMIFGGAMLALLSTVGFQQLRFAWKNARDIFYIIDLPLIGIPWCGLVLTMIAVAYQTWRTTILEVVHGEVKLTFKTLFKTRSYVWDRNELAISFTETHVPQVGPVLAELHMLPFGGPLFRLFIDHDLTEVKKLHTLLALAMEGAAPIQNLDLPSESEVRVNVPLPPEVDPANVAHLAQQRAQWRKKL